MKSLTAAGSVLSLMLMLSGVVRAAEMDPAMMERAAKWGAPGDQHKRLEPFAGSWNYTAKMWMKPGDKPMDMKGTAQNDWILGGRFLKMTARGEMNGQPFEGLGYTGFDNVRGEYQSTWMDNMMTGIMKVTGNYDSATKTIKQSGTFGCPMTGEKDLWTRSEWKAVSNDKNLYSAYSKDENGKEFKSMEITYTRAK